MYRFESFCLDTRCRELRSAGGAPVPLTAKAFDTLCVLVDNRDRVVSKDELLSAVWPGRVVEENNLSQAISALRRALGTDASDHRYLVTVPGRGYQFVADVQECDPMDAAAAAPRGDVPQEATPAAAPAYQRDPGLGAGSRRAIALGAVLFMLVLFAVAAWRMRDAPGLPTAVAAAPAAAVSQPQHALAVLPFRSLSTGAPDPLLELGLAESLITRLGRASSLRVRSLASTKRLAAKQRDALAVGRALDASYVVDGSTQRIGNRVRVNVRLLSVSDASALLSQTFDTDIDRVFTLQDQIGDAVTTALDVQPVLATSRTVAPCDANDAAAFRAMLRAQYMLHRRAPGTIAAYQDAIRLDPSCGRAYAGLATAYLYIAHNDAPPDEVFPLSRGAAVQAMKINPDLADAHLAYGRYLQLHDWNWPAAEVAMRRAIELNPSLADARLGYAHFLTTTGRFDEGLEQARQARELDPLSPFVNAIGAGFLTAAGKPDVARQWLARSLELEPDFWVALLVRGGLALDSGDAEAAVADLQRAADHSHRASQVLAVLAIAQVAAGRPAEAEAIRDELLRRARTGYVQPTSLAAVENALGHTDAALDALERALREHEIRIGFIKVDARWNNLRGERRFEALMRKLELPEAPAHGRY